MAEERGSDKMPLSEYVESIAEQYLEAVAAVEKANPTWEFGAVTITARGVLKPMTVDGKTTVFVDIDEGAKVERSEIPIPLARRKV